MMRAGDRPDFPWETLQFTKAEYAELLYRADQDGVSIEAFIKTATLEVLRRKFGGTPPQESGVVLPFKKPGGPE